MLYAAFTVFAALLLTSTRVHAQETGAVDEYYRSVLTRMNALAQPPLVAYDVVARASGATFYVTRDSGTGEAEFGFSVGSALGDTDQRWPVIVRTADETTSVHLSDAYAVTRFPALNATWGGIDSWMRFGMQDAAPPQQARGVVAQPSRGPALPPVIAVVRTLGLGNYRVGEGGTATCDGGAPARLLHLTARDDGSKHPATDLTIDSATQLICTIRFHIERSALVERDGYVELHFEPVDRYYVVTRGEIAFTAGYRLGHQHVRLFLDYVGVAFPSTAPARAFTVSKDSAP